MAAEVVEESTVLERFHVVVGLRKVEMAVRCMDTVVK